jgi:hypothetical protein
LRCATRQSAMRVCCEPNPLGGPPASASGHAVSCPAADQWKRDCQSCACVSCQNCHAL